MHKKYLRLFSISFQNNFFIKNILKKNLFIFNTNTSILLKKIFSYFFKKKLIPCKSYAEHLIASA
jgi:hypothetical protein